MNRLKKILATVLSLMLVLTSITIPALANDAEIVEATNVAAGKSSTASRASAGIAPYTDLATITDGIYFANNGQNQYITYGPSLIAIDLEANYLVSKLIVDAVAVNFTKNLEVYVSKDPMNGDAVPSGAVKVLAGEAGGWSEGVKTVELGEAVEGRYVILYMTSNASPSFRLSEVEVWGIPGTGGGDDEGGEGGEEGGEVVEPVDLVELATGKAAFAYGSLDDTDPAMAVDGDVNTYWSSVTQTGGVYKSIVIDLGADCEIYKYAVIPNATGSAKNLKIYGATEAELSKRVFHKDVLGVFDGNVGKSLEDNLSYINWDGNPTYRYLTIETTNSNFDISEISILGVVADGVDVQSGNVVRITDDATIYVSNEKSQYNMTISNFATRDYVADSDPSTLFGVTQAGDNVLRITYDLGAEMPVSHMAYQLKHPGMDDYGNNVTLFATNSLDREFNEANLDKIAFIEKPTFVSSNTGLLVFEMPEELKENKYRYVGIYKKDYQLGSLKRLAACSLYAYVPESAIEDMITDSEAGYSIIGESASADSSIASYDASLVMKPGTYNFAALYGTRDENGAYAETAYATDSVTRGTAGFADINLDAVVTTDGVWEGIILDGLKVLRGYTDIKKGTEISDETSGAATEPSLSKIGNSLTFGGKANGEMVGIVVLKPGADFDGYTESDIVDHKVIYAPESAKGVWDFMLDYTFDDELATGMYTIGFFCSGNDAEISGKTFTAEKINVDAVADAFENVTEDNFDELVEANVAFFGNAADAFTDSDTMAESFVLAKDAVEKGLFDESVTEWNVEALTVTAMSAIVVDKTLNSSDFAEEIAPYINSMPDVFGEEYDAEEFEQIFPAVLEEDGADNAQELVDAYKKANVLSVIAGGNTKEVEKAIKENSDILGISESTLRKVTPLQLAKKLDTKIDTVVRSYVGGMASIAEEIADEIEASLGSGGKVLGGGGSGGFGGGSNAVASVPPASTGNQGNGSGTSNETETASPVTYNDLAGFDWATGSIMTLSERGIINGKGYGKFDPAGKLTREEAVKLLVTATGTPTDESYNGYDDCVIGSWYYPYITAAKINGLVTGFSRTQFGLGSQVTRQDLAVMIYRAMQKQNLVKAVDAAEFADEEKIADYALEAVKNLGGMGIITGFEDGSFAPDANATRAEAAVIFARYLELSENMAEEGAK